MSVKNEKYNPEELPPEEFSEQEKALLNAHLNQERKLNWKQLAGPRPKNFKPIIGKKWVWLILVLLLTTLFCWQKGWFSTFVPVEHPVMASRTDLLEYPFDNLRVRGGNEGQALSIPPQSLDAYRKKDFRTALETSGPANHFFNGICWLQLKDTGKALGEFEQIPADDPGHGDEFFYYKGVALQEVGRKAEAKIAFQRVLDSRTIRKPFRMEAEARIGK